MELTDLINLLTKLEYTNEEIKLIKNAYEYANLKHGNQIRQSGEPYIIHPLHVAYTLAELHADANTIAAGLLHDVLEDTDTTKEEIVTMFNAEIANLVDGVTNLSDKDYSSREMAKIASMRKLFLGATEDVRIILIKLSDRLHNMQTLQFKSPEKQQEKAHETLDIFVPTASHIGTYELQRNLEDLSFKYLNPDQYHFVKELKMRFSEHNMGYVVEAVGKFRELLEDNHLNGDVSVRERNIYSLYNKLQSGFKVNELHDILAIKVILERAIDCYQYLGHLHLTFKSLDEEYNDYIGNPKPNMYQSLHSSLFVTKDKVFQTRIRTKDMDLIANRGIAAYWTLDRENAAARMQSAFENKLRLTQTVRGLSSMYPNDEQFLDSIKHELFAKPIYVHSISGNRVEMPSGSTPIDFAYRIRRSLGDAMVAAKVNGEFVPVSYKLEDQDIVNIIVDKSHPVYKAGWEEMATTSYARQRIREYNRKFKKNN